MKHTFCPWCNFKPCKCPTAEQLEAYRNRGKWEGDEAETRRRENAQRPRLGYPGAEQMMRYQRDYK